MNYRESAPPECVFAACDNDYENYITLHNSDVALTII